jgi:MoaA/NifB/PqqE/SkfB family radical SAM enzyme
MGAEQLLLVLPNQAQGPSGSELTVHHWAAIVEQFAATGGRELFLGGAEPLGYPGFWSLVRRGLKAGLPRVTAYLGGSHLEPWVLRELVESGLHLSVTLDSLTPDPHDALHGSGRHARAMAALETFLNQGLAPRVGILATATRLNHTDLPMLGAWAAGRGVTRFLWSTVPDGGWPSPQLKALRLTSEEKVELATRMQIVSRSVVGNLYIGPLDMLEDPAMLVGCSRLLRVSAQGEAVWGFSGEGVRLGNVRHQPLSELLTRATQAAGD